MTRQETIPVVPVVESTPAPVRRQRPLFPAITLIVVLLLVVALEATYLLNRNKEETAAEEATPVQDLGFIFTAADGMVTGIEIKPAEGESVKITRNAENVWEMLLPTEAEADQSYMEMAASQLTRLPISRQIEDNKPLDAFGLDKPAYVITVEFKDGKTRKLEIGVKPIAANGYYVRLDKDIMIADGGGIDALLQLQSVPPYLNTPTPTALPPTEAPIPTATVEATATPAP